MALTEINSKGIKDADIATADLADDAITSAKIADDAVVAAAIADDAVTSAAIADEAIDEARLQISNAGSNGQFLSKQTGNTGGLTWATVDVPKLASPVLTGDTGILTSGTASVTISNYSSDCTYVFASLTNCTIGTVNASGVFVVTNTGSQSTSFTIKATTTSLGLADSDVTAKSFTAKLAAPTLNTPSDVATATNVAYTITSNDANDDKLVIDYGSSNFSLVSTSHGSASKVGNTVEVTGFTTNNPVVTTTFSVAATYSVKAKAVKIDNSFAESAYSATDSITILNAYNVSFYVQGGGGGGAVTGGGGGAGGHRSSWNSETSGGGGNAESPISMVVGTQYTVTVGGGGSGGSGWGQSGSSGSASSIAGSGLTTITSLGGGNGSHSQQGGSGGCGGGNGYGNSSNGGQGTANQGYNGGTGSGTHGLPGGGGGGCSGNGTNAHGGQGGNGGYGRESTISGSAVTIGGGGGSGSRGSNSPGIGRNGGGNGATCNCGGGGGATNSGSGGGSAGGDNSTASGGSGGSGIVYLRMPTSDYSGTTSGSPNVSTSGSDTIIKFTGSGSYTA